MKMPIEASRKLTEIRNNCDHFFCFYRQEDKDGVAYWSDGGGTIEDTIFEVLNGDEHLLEMFAVLVEEVYEFKAEQN